MRTTVLVRRQHRRDKIEAAKVAAVEGVKEAGRKGLAASAAGAEAAGQAAVKMAKSAAEGTAEGAEKGLALLVRAAAAARSRIASASAPVNARLSTPRVSLILAVVASLGSAAFAVRAWQFGTDADAIMLGVAALVAGLALALAAGVFEFVGRRRRMGFAHGAGGGRRRSGRVAPAGRCRGGFCGCSALVRGAGGRALVGDGWTVAEPIPGGQGAGCA